MLKFLNIHIITSKRAVDSNSTFKSQRVGYQSNKNYRIIIRIQTTAQIVNSIIR